MKYKMDLRPYKENIPIISELIQKHAFDLGITWGGAKVVSYTHCPFLWVDLSNRRLTHVDARDASYFDRDRCLLISVNTFLGM